MLIVNFYVFMYVVSVSYKTSKFIFGSPRYTFLAPFKMVGA